MMMKAAVYDAPGAPEVLRYEDVPVPALGIDQVLIAVEAISVNQRDLNDRGLIWPPHPMWIPGTAAAGTVIAAGSYVHNRKVGDRVAAFDNHGSHAALWAVPVVATWLIPPLVNAADAAALPAAYGTAYHGLFVRGQLRRGETLLVQAAWTEVGLAAVQLAGRAGANVLAVGRGSARCDRIRALGAYHVVDLEVHDVVRDLLRLTGQRGVDLVFDPSGSSLAISLGVLSEDGRLVILSNSVGAPLSVALSSLGSNRALLVVQTNSVLERSTVYLAVDQLFALLAAKDIRMILDCTFPLREAAAAHRYAEASDPFGSVILTP
ncbi:quinone oxidoreductase family protein [Aquincola tertiaricarbonis]|uniref:quinone oxidoreductase family protein n=1 Tax=Aquincola tertiaricarbonis TaxID=391953 RepID=UPI001E39672E|nr:zinc-binding alcohol dehydrogenase family protein [Aquincola tertiaricarbonis]